MWNWEGTVDVSNVTRFQATALLISAANDLEGILPEHLNMVSYTDPNTMYVELEEKLAKSSRKLHVLLIFPFSDIDSIGHKILFQYFEKCNYVGVAQSLSPDVDRVFVIALPDGVPLPSLLNNHVDNKLSANHKDLLLAIALEESTLVDSDESESSTDKQEEQLWCICKQRDDGRFMICCDRCNVWFHGDCVNVDPNMNDLKSKKWKCPFCVKAMEIETSSQHTATPIKNGKMNQGADSTVRKRVQHGWYAKLDAKHDTSLRAVDRPVRKRVRPQENTHDTATNSQLLAEMTAAIPKKLKISNQKAISATQPKNGNNVATYEGHPLADNLSRLWCHCRRKHMMQYMIECDRCKIFYHGNCVGMSMSLEAEMHKKKRKWICASCISIWNEYVNTCTCGIRRIGLIIECEKCKRSYHGECMGITDEDYRRIQNNGQQWLCPECFDKQEPAYR